MWLSHETATSTSAYIVARNTTSELFYTLGPDGGNFLFVPSLGGAVNVNANDTEASIGVILFNSTPLGQNWVYPSVNGRVTLLGLNNLSGGAGPIIHKASNGGWGVNNFLQRDWTFDKICQYLDPDLYIVMLGQNDGAMGQAVYEDKLTDLYFRLKNFNPDGKILFVSSYNSGAPNGQEHSDAMRSVSLARSAGFIDLYTAGGNRQFYLDNNYLDPDGVHFSAAGGLYVSTLIFNALETYGGSLQICDSVDFNGDGFFPDTADLDAYLLVFSGGTCGGCGDIDFNNDGYYPDTADMDALLRVFSGGTCIE